MRRITEKISLRLFGVLVVATIFLGFFIASPIYAQTDYYWVGTSGSWSDPNNWSLTPGGPGGAGVPPASSSDFIINSGATDWVIDHVGGRYLTVDTTGTGTVTFLNFYPNGEAVSVGQHGTALIDLSGGPGSIYAGSSNINLNNTLYTFSSGRIYVDGHFTISNSTFNQTDGTAVQVNAGPYITNSTYNMSGGTIDSTYMSIGGGTFNQTGGVVGGGRYLPLYIDGTYNLSGTGVIGPLLYFRVDGTFNQNGGQVMSAPDSTISGTYNLAGGSLTVPRGITNTGNFNYTGGSLSIATSAEYPQYFAFTNNGTATLSGSGTRVVEGDVVNNGTWKVTDTTAVYTGTFTNNGAYISDPAKNYFNSLLINNTGYLVGGTGDEFHFSGDLLNHSQNPLWNTNKADLFFGPGSHTFFLGDTGSSFNWDDMTLDFGATLDLEGGATLHVEELHLFDFSQLTGRGYLFYDSLVFESVPEPATMLLFGLGLMGLVGLKSRFQNQIE